MATRERLGDIYYAQEKYQEARRQYRYIFERRRHAGDVALKLVQVYLCLPNRLRQAYNVLRRTVHHNPKHLMAWLRYANFCRVLIRDYEEVAQYLLSRCTVYIACVVVAHRVGRPDLKASPSRLLWSY